MQTRKTHPVQGLLLCLLLLGGSLLSPAAPIISEILADNESVILEGVHLELDFVVSLMKRFRCIIPFAIYIR